MDKKTRAMETIIEKYDSFIKDMEIQMRVERDAINKHRIRVELLENMRGEAETTRTSMVESMNGSLN